MTLTFGVDAEGKICGIQIDNYTDSIDVREKDANFLPSFIGQDSALTDVYARGGLHVLLHFDPQRGSDGHGGAHFQRS